MSSKFLPDMEISTSNDLSWGIKLVEIISILGPVVFDGTFALAYAIS